MKGMYTICLGNSSLIAYLSYSDFDLLSLLFNISKALLILAFEPIIFEFGGSASCFLDSLRRIVND